MACLVAYDDRIPAGHSLQAGSKVGCFPHDSALLRGAFTDDVSYNYGASGDADAHG